MCFTGRSHIVPSVTPLSVRLWLHFAPCQGFNLPLGYVCVRLWAWVNSQEVGEGGSSVPNFFYIWANLKKFAGWTDGVLIHNCNLSYCDMKIIFGHTRSQLFPISQHQHTRLLCRRARVVLCICWQPKKKKKPCTCTPCTRYIHWCPLFFLRMRKNHAPCTRLITLCIISRRSSLRSVPPLSLDPPRHFAECIYKSHLLNIATRASRCQSSGV